MKRLILSGLLILILISPYAVSAQMEPSANETLSQSTTDAWFALSDVVLSQFSPDGRYLAVRTSTRFQVYDTQQATPTIIIEDEANGNPYEGTLIAFSPDGKWVAINIEIERPVYTVRVWELATAGVVAEITQDFFTVDQLAFSRTEPLLIISHRYDINYYRGEVSLWEFETDIIRHTVRPGGGGRLISISPNGEWLLMNVVNGTSSLARVYNLQTDEINDDSFLGCDCFVSPTWEYAILRFSEPLNTPFLVRLPSLEELDFSIRFKDTFGNFAWNYDGRLLAAVEASGMVRIFDLIDDSELTIGATIEAGRLPYIYFHPQENIIALVYHDNTIELWDADAGTILHELSVQADYLEFHQFSPDGSMMSAKDSNNRIHIWGVESGDQMYQFEIDVEGPVWSQFSADGRLFLAREHYDEGQLWLWRLWPNSSQNSE